MKYFLFFLLFPFKLFSQCDSLIIVYSTLISEDDNILEFYSLEIDSVKNGQVVYRDVNGDITKYTYDSFNRMQSRATAVDSIFYTYDSNSRLVSEENYEFNSGWNYRSDTAKINYYYSTHGIDSVYIYTWDGISLNPFYHIHLFYNSNDTLYLKESEIFDSIQWVTDTITTVTYGSFGQDIYRRDTTYGDSISPSTIGSVYSYDQFGRILRWEDDSYGFPNEYEMFAYECNQLAHWQSSAVGMHSGLFMNLVFDPQCRIRTSYHGHYSEANGAVYYVDDYSYVDCSTMMVRVSEDVRICSGDSTEISAIHFGGVGPYAIHWSPSQGLACDTCLITQAAPDQTTMYTMFVTDSAGHTETDYLEITVTNRPFAHLYIASIDTISNCQSAVLAADSLSNSGIAWFKDNIYVYPHFDFHLPISFNGEYVIQVGTSLDCPYVYDTLQFNFFTHVPPTVILNRSCKEIFATASPNTTIQWFHENQLITDSLRDTLITNQLGMYSTIVTDSVGCSSEIKKIWLEEVVATSNASPSCPGSCNGTIYLNTHWYNDFAWSNGSTNQNAQHLCPGIYSVIVSDDFGCTVSVSDTITEYPPGNFNLLTTGTSTPNACDGVAIVVDTSNTPYNSVCNWEGFEYGNMKDSLCPGWHTVNIFPDFSHCLQTDSFYISSSPSHDTCSILETHTDMDCFQYANGTITINCSTGSPFACYWPDPNYLTSHDLHRIHLSDGTYTCVMIDRFGCVDTAQITINEPLPLSLSVTSYQSPCGDSCVFTASATGGVPPYSFRWNNSVNGDHFYSCDTLGLIYFNDHNHCGFSDSIYQPTVSPVVFHTINTLPSCLTCVDGRIVVMASGGAPPYSYTIDGNQVFDDTISNVAWGNHAICVNDMNGCSTCDNQIVLSVDPITSDDFSYSPNPFHESVVFHIGDFDPAVQCEIEIYDITARLVRSNEITSNRFEFFRHELPPGIYSFVLRMDNRIRQRGKLVID